MVAKRKWKYILYPKSLMTELRYLTDIQLLAGTSVADIVLLIDKISNNQ